jgi:hypothetical protein
MQIAEYMRALFSALVLSLGASGCAIPTRIQAVDPKVPRESTSIAMDAAVGEMEEAKTRRRIERVLASPEVKDAERELMAGMVDGSLAALSERDRGERVSAVTSRFISEAARSSRRPSHGCSA